jgi:hypothetical protein
VIRYRERAAIRSGSAGLDFQKGSLRFRFLVVSFHTVQGWRPAHLVPKRRAADRFLRMLVSRQTGLSGNGSTKRTSRDVCYLSAFGGKADISQRSPGNRDLRVRSAIGCFEWRMLDPSSSPSANAASNISACFERNAKHKHRSGIELNFSKAFKPSLPVSCSDSKLSVMNLEPPPLRFRLVSF